MFTLNADEKERLKSGIKAAFSVPFIDDIEDFIWEAIFAHAKSVPLQDPLTTTRSKQLFDLVDPVKEIGWSAKALQWRVSPGVEFELVIQRADIFKKAEDLGFPPLSVNSPPLQLGEALLTHWQDWKVARDMQAQAVSDPRICILLKSIDRKKFAYYEDTLERHVPDEIQWSWTNSSKTGLQGTREGFVKYRWYPNQKQFFERFVLPDDAEIIPLSPRRLPLTEVIELLTAKIEAVASK